MICEHCGEDKKEYVGFASRAGDPSNPWDCLNKNCSPKTTKPPSDLPDGFVFKDDMWGIPVYYTWSPEKYEREDIATVFMTGGKQGELRGVGHLFVTKYGGHYHIYDSHDARGIHCSIPTQSEPDQSSSAQPATQASSRQPRRQGFQKVAASAGANGLLPLAPNLSLDDPDQCTLQQQGSDLPPSLGTPSSQYVTLDAETLRASMANPEAFLPIKKV